jgi:hypothetical protein
MDPGALVPLPALNTQCGVGYGMAACPTLGLLVTTDYFCNTLNVFTLPPLEALASHGSGAGASAGLALAGTLGGATSPKQSSCFLTATAPRVGRPSRARPPPASCS